MVAAVGSSAASVPTALPLPDPVSEVTSRRFDGPIELDLGRIVLPHRVENVPPPPDFIFEPFVSSRSSSRSQAALAPAPALRIEPQPCRIVDEREAGRRVDRGWRVDVAPCVDVGVDNESRRQPRRRGPLLARRLLAAPITSPATELEAASA
jgi:hypothetical protein